MAKTGKVASASKGNAKVNAAAKGIRKGVAKLSNTKQQQPHGPLSKPPNG